MKTRFILEILHLFAVIGMCSRPALAAQESTGVPAIAGVRESAILLSASGGPAEFSCDVPQGRIQSKNEGAAAATRWVLNTPELGNSWINAAAGIVEFVFAPVAAGYGAVSSGRARLPGDRLMEAQSALSHAMQVMAEQGKLLEQLSLQTNELAHPMVALSSKLTAPESALARVEIHTEQLRLERVDKHDNFALRILTRARLRPSGSNSELLDRIYEYRSDKAMFIDWTMTDAFESVARSGYEDLAGRISKDIAKALEGEPLLLGAGYRDTSKQQKDKSPHPEIGIDAEAQQVAIVNFRRSPGQLASLPNEGPTPALLPAAYQPESPSFEIHATDKAGLVVQLPQTRSEALAVAQSDTEYALGGFEDDRNFVVQTGAALAAVPLGFWEQSRAMWSGLTAKRIAKAQAHLAAVTNQMRPQELIAFEVARNWTASGGAQVLLAHASAQNYRHASSSTPASIRQNDTLSIQVRVTQAGLVGPEGINPLLALTVEACATLVRAADGAEICAVPVKYRSTARRFTAWAAHDANAFRNETATCYRQIGQCAARELASRAGKPLSSPREAFAAN